MTGSDQTSDVNAARISDENSSGCSQAAKWPPLSTSRRAAEIPVFVSQYRVASVMGLSPLIPWRCLARGLGPGLDRRHGGGERLGQPALADAPEDGAEQAAPQVLAIAHHDGIDIGRPVGFRVKV
jgi:hypothetical protein